MLLSVHCKPPCPHSQGRQPRGWCRLGPGEEAQEWDRGARGLRMPGSQTSQVSWRAMDKGLWPPTHTGQAAMAPPPPGPGRVAASPGRPACGEGGETSHQPQGLTAPRHPTQVCHLSARPNLHTRWPKSRSTPPTPKEEGTKQGQRVSPQEPTLLSTRHHCLPERPGRPEEMLPGPPVAEGAVPASWPQMAAVPAGCELAPAVRPFCPMTCPRARSCL